MSEKSLGMIETWGYVAAVEALDAGMKAANVFSVGCKITPSALVTVSFLGDVSAVKTAVSAGVAAARKVGKVVAHHVIPRPDAQLRPVFPRSDRSAVPPPEATGNTEDGPSGAPTPETRIPAAVTGLPPEETVAGDPDSKTGPRVRSKKSPRGKMAKRSAGKPISSPKKTADRRQKKNERQPMQKTSR